jgi:hypothetical protein
MDTTDIIAISITIVFLVLLLIWRFGSKKTPSWHTSQAAPAQLAPAPTVDSGGVSFKTIWPYLWPTLLIGAILYLGWTWSGRTPTHKAGPAPQTRQQVAPHLSLTLDPLSYNRKMSTGIEENKDISPPEIIVLEGGRIVFSFFSNQDLPRDKSVLVKAVLVPVSENPQLHGGDPLFSIGDSPNQKIILRGGSQEIVMGCPAREIKQGKNYFSYESRGEKFKIAGFIKIQLSP